MRVNKVCLFLGSSCLLPWRLSSAVLVCRLPVVSPEFHPIEKKMLAMHQDIENQRSLKCDHELRYVHLADILSAKNISFSQDTFGQVDGQTYIS